MSTNDAIGIYIHIPFCQSRCIYCDFFSTTSHHKRTPYVEALCREVELRSRQGELAHRPVRTIYLGGGTPSQLEPNQLQQLFASIAEHFDIMRGAEITMEANPDDISDAYLKSLQYLPVNRLSFGLQTFSNTRLQFLHRRHTAEEAIDTIHRCQDAGYENISIDLIFGFPNETLNDWEEDMQQALKLHVQHISAYTLMYEEGTPLYNMLRRGEIHEIDEELSRNMYELLMQRMKAAGYKHYEISNFALPGFHSRHNSSYWEGIPYIGVGAGAHSYDGENRSQNVASLNEYIEKIQEGIRPYQTEHLTLTEKYDEYVMVRLRTSTGICLQTLRETFGPLLYDYFMHTSAPHILAGRLIQGKGHVHLSETGIFVSDDVMSDLMYA